MPEAPLSRGAQHPPTAVPRDQPPTSATRTTTAAGPSGLLASLAPLLAEWLPRQRWFAGKGRPVTGFALVSATELLPWRAGGGMPGLLHLLIRAQQPEPPGHRHGFGCGHRHGAAASDCYQLLLGARPTLPPPLAPALIGRPSGGPLAGQTVYEALFDPRLTTLLLERLRMPGRLGPLRFVREPSSAIPSALPPRVMTAEQSNSSVIYGDTFILKLFRRVSPGTNPDLELPLALAHTGCTRVPAPAAWFEAEPPAEGAGPPPEPVTLGVLQPFLTGSRDGWQLALDALAAGGDFTDAARALGQATAE
ncbi:maltokinase, partial [Streptomyces sp. 4503]|nr:maltokinase [Streptomyces niphimycinicus]